MVLIQCMTEAEHKAQSEHRQIGRVSHGAGLVHRLVRVKP
jgi:hypothetical protein